MSTSTITPTIVKHVASLAKLPITASQITKLGQQLSRILEYMDTIKSLKTDKVAETSQVTQITNRLRPDKIDTSRMLSQKEALRPAHHTHKGYFMVKSVFAPK